MTYVEYVLLSVIIAVLSGVGAWVIALQVWRGMKTVHGIIRDLATALHDAVALAKEFRSDFAAFRAFMAFQATQAPAQARDVETDEGETERPSNSNVQEFPSFPTPVFDRFDVVPQAKKEEPDAPLERVDEIDVTATDQEMRDIESLEELRKVGVQTEALEAERIGRQVESE